MKVAATLIALAGVANAFAPAQNVAKTTALSANLEDMAGATMPFKGYDPLGLATLGSESTLAWFRAAELKHSRVAMLATTGYLVQAAGCHFPGMLSSDVSFETLSAMKPLDAWDAVPDLGKLGLFIMVFYSCNLDNISYVLSDALILSLLSISCGIIGKAQIYFTIFFAEVVSEARGTHYTKGGDYPTIVFPPVNFAPDDAEELKTAQSRELNNGRLAMIAIMSFVAAANIPGSVPALIGNPMF